MNYNIFTRILLVDKVLQQFDEIFKIWEEFLGWVRNVFIEGKASRVDFSFEIDEFKSMGVFLSDEKNFVGSYVDSFKGLGHSNFFEGYVNIIISDLSNLEYFYLPINQ